LLNKVLDWVLPFEEVKAEPVIEPKKKRKITLLPVSDFHTGGTTALHPNVRMFRGNYEDLTSLGGWPYIDNPHFYPSARQVEIWKHYDKCLTWAAELRKDSELVMVIAGDAVEGEHHNTSQLITRDVGEMMQTHEELITYTQHRLDFDRGDSLYYLFGTDTHTRNTENLIAQRLNAYQYPSGRYCANFLEMHLNGVKVWLYHQGVAAGNYPTRGEALMRQLKKIWYQCKMRGETPPDLVITAHTHDPVYSVYSQDWHTIHGVILPSWQEKTRYANDKLPVAINKIGMQAIQISEDGIILPIQKPMLMESPLGDTVTI